MELNSNQGCGETNWFNFLLNRFLFRLLFWILLNFFRCIILFLHQFALKFELPRLSRDRNILIFGLDEIVKNWHDVQWSGVYDELRSLFAETLLNDWLERVVHVEISIKYVAFGLSGTTTTVLSASAGGN